MKKNKNIILPDMPLVWLVPVIALGVALWMIYPQYIDRGTEILIEFPSAAGIQAENTSLEYLGVPAGKVKEIKLKKDLKGVWVKVRLNEDAKILAHRGAQFWVEKPQVGLSGVSGLETLLSGAHINVIPGNGPAETKFVGLASPPTVNEVDKGRAFFVFSDHMGTLQPHASVQYKGFKVGEVESSQLTDDAQGVITRLRIYSPYVNLVRKNTRFWDAGGLSINMSLFGASIKTTSIESIISGAVAFATPDEPADLAVDGEQFKLNEKPQDVWQKWSPAIKIQTVDSMPAKNRELEEELEKPVKELKDQSRR